MKEKYINALKDILNQVFYGFNYCRNCYQSKTCGEKNTICRHVLESAAQHLDEDIDYTSLEVSQELAEAVEN